MLRRIVQNFLSNAIRYTQEGRVLLGCRRQGERLSIEVWDSGPGIPEAKQAEIFQEFRRLDQASRHKESEKGLGLGLSIAERMSRVLDHPIRVRSEEGAGTVFAVSVPVVEARSQEVAEEKSKTRRAGNKLAGTRILCIDNETLILEGMKRCSPAGLRSLHGHLHRWCQVGTAPSGCRSRCHPGRLPSRQRSHRLMAMEALAERLNGNVPGIVITADRTEEVAETVKRAGYHLLLKPVRPAALRALLTRTLQASRAAAR